MCMLLDTENVHTKFWVFFSAQHAVLLALMWVILDLHENHSIIFFSRCWHTRFSYRQNCQKHKMFVLCIFSLFTASYYFKWPQRALVEVCVHFTSFMLLVVVTIQIILGFHWRIPLKLSRSFESHRISKKFGLKNIAESTWTWKTTKCIPT